MWVLILLTLLNLELLLLCYGVYRLVRLQQRLLISSVDFQLALDRIHGTLKDEADREKEQRKLIGKSWVPGETEQARLEKNLRAEAGQRAWAGGATGLRRFAP